MKRKKVLLCGLAIIVYGILVCGCESTVSTESATQTEEVAQQIGQEKTAEQMSTEEVTTEEVPTEENEARQPGLLPEERESIHMGKLSSEHIYYEEVVHLDPACADYIQELSIYDKEIDDTFVVHISLPPTYDETKEYPLVVMTDGVWRLSDHPELRPLMNNGVIDDVILISIGYPNDYDYRTIRERDLVNHPNDFLHFIVDNLIPYLSEIYSVSDKNTTLTGHSYGGYFAYYTLFHSDTIARNTFENYYIGSPSMQAHTGKMYIRNYEQEYYESCKELIANVYITVGGEEDSGFVSGIESFEKSLEERNYDGLNIIYEVIEGYSHDTVFKPSIRNALGIFYGKSDVGR